MAGRRAAVAGMLGRTVDSAPDVEQDGSAPPTLRRVWSRLVLYAALGVSLIPIELVPSWRDHGASAGSAFWAALVAVQLSQVWGNARELRRRYAVAARSAGTAS